MRAVLRGLWGGTVLQPQRQHVVAMTGVPEDSSLTALTASTRPFSRAAGSRCCTWMTLPISRELARFLKCKNDATVAAAIIEIIAMHVAPVGFKLGIVRTDGDGEFARTSQSLLPQESHIQYESITPHTPQYKGVVERALDIPRDKIIILL